jgi:hypothetical protein
MLPEDPRELRFKYPEELQGEAWPNLPPAPRSRRWWLREDAACYSSSRKKASRVRKV